MINTTDRPRTDVPITLEKADAEHVRRTFDDGGDYLVLTIGDSEFTLRPEELPGGLHQAHELQRLRTAALEQHEPWCDQARHARTAGDFLEPVPECIGRDHPITLSGHPYGGYWRQQSDGTARLVTEWPGWCLVEMSVEDVRAAYRVALAFGANRDVEQVTTMLGDALDEYEGGDDWRDTF